MRKDTEPEFTVPYEDAVRIAGSEAKLRGLAPSKQAASNWKARGGVPARYMIPLTIERARSSLGPEKPLHQRAEWREIKSFTACVEMLWRLAQRDQWRSVNAVRSVLEVMTEWTDDDWEKLYRAKIDHLVTRLREEQKV